MMPLLRAGLQVFETVEGSGKRSRVKDISNEQTTRFPPDPNDPNAPTGDLLELSGTVIDGSGHTWDLDVTGVPGVGGDVDLLGQCGRGRPAPASQQSPGAINYPCKMIQVEFLKGTPNPRKATIAQWTTVKTVKTLRIGEPSSA
jgi:hypothetical protein